MKKYPRTYHFSFSPEVHSDDKVIDFEYEDKILNSEIVITLKMDGGNCCIKEEGVFARTHAMPTICETFNYIKNVHYYGKLDLLNKNYWYFGENMFAIHSIQYNELEDYFYVFNIYDKENDIWLSWEDVKKEAKRCNFNVVKEIFVGKLNPKEIKKLLENSLKLTFFGGFAEGFVIRTVDSFTTEEFEQKVCKYVRKGHVKTDEHWSTNWKKQNLIKAN